METYETNQKWITYRYGRTHDRWWPLWNSTRVLGFAKIDMTCAICGKRQIARISMPRLGQIVDRGPHPQRTAFLEAHRHPNEANNRLTWAIPLGGQL